MLLFFIEKCNLFGLVYLLLNLLMFWCRCFGCSYSLIIYISNERYRFMKFYLPMNYALVNISSVVLCAHAQNPLKAAT